MIRKLTFALAALLFLSCTPIPAFAQQDEDSVAGPAVVQQFTSPERTPNPECLVTRSDRPGRVTRNIDKPLRFCTPPAWYDQSAHPGYRPFDEFVIDFNGETFHWFATEGQQIQEFNICELATGGCSVGSEYDVSVRMVFSGWARLKAGTPTFTNSYDFKLTFAEGNAPDGPTGEVESPILLP